MAREWTMTSASKYSSMARLFDPPATQNQILVVKYGCLPRCDSALRLIEVDFDALRLTGRVERRLRGRVLVADLDLCARRRRQSWPGYPIHFSGHQPRAQQVVVPTHDHALRGRLSSDHIQRLSSGDTQSAPLPDRKMMHAGMPTERASIHRNDLAPRRCLGRALLAQIGLQERCIVAVGNEADLLAVVLLGDRQSQAARNLANFRLIQLPDGEQRSC